MNKIYFSLLCFFLSCVFSIGQSTQIADEKPEIALLGTFHFAGSPDLLSLDTKDLSSPKRQQEIEALVESLASYKPTKIILEYPYGNNRLDSLYRLYRSGNHQLTINERQQLGFRLAKKLGHEHIYTADYKLDLPFNSLMEYLEANGKMHVFQELLNKMKREVIDVLQEELDAGTITDVFLFMNREKYDLMNRNAYLQYFNQMGSEIYLGSEIVSKWWERNIKIMANIDAITQPGDRVFVLFGQGHTSILKDFYKNRDDVTYVDILSYLED